MPTPAEKKTILGKRLAKFNNESEKYFLSSLPRCCLAYAMQDSTVVDDFACQLSNALELCGDVIPSEIAALFYVLRSRKTPLLLHVGAKTNFVDKSFSCFFQAFLEFKSMEKVIKIKFCLKTQTI